MKHVLEVTPSGSITHFEDGTSVTRLTRTPPVENSNPEGGPKGADGQGVCTYRYQIDVIADRPACLTESFLGVDLHEAVHLVSQALQEGKALVVTSSRVAS